MAHAYGCTGALGGSYVMELRRLNPYGPMVSTLALGGTKFGRVKGVKYPSSFQLPSDDELSELLALAKKLGINLVDTAPSYGNSEERIGALVGHDPHWIIATKVGELFVNGRSIFDFSPASIRDSVERSRSCLRRDFLDIVTLHLPDNDETVLRNGETIATLLDLQAKGIIGLVGASTKTVAAGKVAIETCDLVMIALNEADQSQRPVLHAAAAAGKGVLIKKPLNSGHTDDAGAALRNLVCQDGITSVVAGTINPSHLQQNTTAVQRAVME